MTKIKTLKATEDTHKELVSLGIYGESMDDTLRRLVEYWKKGHGGKK